MTLADPVHSLPTRGDAMKALLVLTGALAAALAIPAAAQQQSTQSAPAAPVRVQVPQGGLTFNFQDIDRNRDNSISVEEWNAFVASLQSRMGAKEGSAAAGATGSSARPPAGSPAQPLPR
jgi:hypothetical protein